MSLTPTAILFGLSAVMLGVGLWNDRRPWQPGKLRVPITVVPGRLNDEQIDALT